MNIIQLCPWYQELAASKPRSHRKSWSVFWTISVVTWQLFQASAVFGVSFVAAGLLFGGNWHTTLRFDVALAVTAFAVSGLSVAIAHKIRTLRG